MIEQIRKEDIEDWEFGDVAIKTYSYGEMLTMQGYEKDQEAGNLKDVGLFVAAAGIHYVRDSTNTNFIVQPNTEAKDKTDFVYKISQKASVCILNRIKNLNKPLDKEEKKE